MDHAIYKNSVCLRYNRKRYIDFQKLKECSGFFNAHKKSAKQHSPFTSDSLPNFELIFIYTTIIFLNSEFSSSCKSENKGGHYLFNELQTNFYLHVKRLIIINANNRDLGVILWAYLQPIFQNSVAMITSLVKAYSSN